MKTKLLLIIATIPVILLSCTKDQKNTPDASYPDYGKLKAGNYWVYQQFVVDTSGNATPLNIFDSCYIEKDTLINGNTYGKYRVPVPYSHQLGCAFLRDSLHYIVASDGTIFFSSENFDSTFVLWYSVPSPGDTLYKKTVKMDDKNMMVSTPAGGFQTSNLKTTYTMFNGFGIGINPRFQHKRYAKDIGLVIETLPFFASNPTTTERRLIRYDVSN